LSVEPLFRVGWLLIAGASVVLYSGDNPARRRRVVVWLEFKVDKPSAASGPCRTVSVDGDDDGDVSPDLLDQVAGRPYGLWGHGNNDTVGAANAVDKVATGLALNKAADVLEVIGTIDAGVRERAYELGGTLAATLME
jgi:hypothetical protein